MIFLAEIGAGWGIYRSGEKAKRDGGNSGGGEGFFRAAPWVLLFALAIVELAAYSTLSVRINLGQRLKLNADGPLYGFAQYFLTFLGLGLTLLLAYLGHAISEGI